MATIKIKQTKSGINRPERQKRTLRALGFTKMNQVLEKEATAVTARVNSVAYGEEAATRCCALTIREAEMSSIAFVIFLVAFTERIRLR